MDPSIKEELEGAVNHFGMRAFIFHDVIAKECFSMGFTSATQGLEEWAAKLTNGSNSQDPLALCQHNGFSILKTECQRVQLILFSSNFWGNLGNSVHKASDL